jgi:hypothetical protein
MRPIRSALTGARRQMHTGPPAPRPAAPLKREGELHETDAEVDSDCELGTVTRRAFGNGDGPALLFKIIKGYRNTDAPNCSPAGCRTIPASP